MNKSIRSTKQGFIDDEMQQFISRRFRIISKKVLTASLSPNIPIERLHDYCTVATTL